MELLITFGVFGLVSGVIYFLFASRAPISDEVIQRRLESISPQAAPVRASGITMVPRSKVAEV